MAYQRWSWLLDGAAGVELDFETEGFVRSPATALFGDGGYPALFSVRDGVGFFAIGPGRGLLYYFDRRRDTAFLFPDSVD